MKGIYVARRATGELLFKVEEVDGQFVPVYKNAHYTRDDDSLMVVDVEETTIEKVRQEYGYEPIHALMNNRAIEVRKDSGAYPPQFRPSPLFRIYVPLHDGRTLVGTVVMGKYANEKKYRKGGRELNDVMEQCYIISERV